MKTTPTKTRCPGWCTIDHTAETARERERAALAGREPHPEDLEPFHRSSGIVLGDLANDLGMVVNLCQTPGDDEVFVSLEVTDLSLDAASELARVLPSLVEQARTGATR